MSLNKTMSSFQINDSPIFEIVDKYVRTNVNTIENNINSLEISIEQLENRLFDLEYTPIKILSFMNNINVFEIGGVINEVLLTWNLNKIPTKVNINNVPIDNMKLKIEQSAIIKNAALNTDKTFTLSVTDEKGKIDKKDTSIIFCNGVYYGTSVIPENINSAFVNTLTKSLQKNRSKTFSISSGENQYVWYGIPNKYGTPVFNVGGFSGGFSKISTLEFQNSNGYIESYAIYRSDNCNLGNQTIKVT